MNINRNNYEEYFLLYADKELSAGEKSSVEMFVQRNPDLEEEFVMLQQSVLKPDNTIALENKSSLFKQEGFIDHGNYEEKFLLYTDNELGLQEMKVTEKFVSANPALQSEFNLLQKVTYEPDTSIVFPDKDLLYRKADDGNIIRLPWRYLAAAVLLGIGLWISIPYLQKNKVEHVVAVKQPPAKENTPANTGPEKELKGPIVRTEQDQTTTREKVIKNTRDNATQQAQQNVAVKNITVDKQQPVNKLPEPKKEDLTKNDPVTNNTILRPDNHLPLPDRTIEPGDKTAISNSEVQNSTQKTNYATPASYIQEEEVKSDNYVFYNITAEEFRKSKIGNFLKKVKRVVAGKIPLINKSLKIGNVEIAKDDQN